MSEPPALSPIGWVRINQPADPPASTGAPEPLDSRLTRLANLVSNLAHPRGDHGDNALEDEAHDIIRALRQATGAPEPGPAIKRWSVIGASDDSRLGPWVRAADHDRLVAAMRPTCPTHGDPLMCLACEAEEHARWIGLGLLPAAQAMLADLEFARSSHLAWAEHLESHMAAGAPPCPECAAKPYTLDPCHEREWVAKYDRLIAFVRRAVSPPALTKE